MSGCRSKRHRDIPVSLRTLVLAIALAHAAPAFAQNRNTETGERVLPVEVTINGGAGGIWPIVSRDGVLYAPADAFGSWRLQVRPETPAIEYRGFRYFALGSVTGLESRLDTNKGTLDLSIPADAFSSTRLTRELSPVLPRTPVVPAVFVNYDLNYSRTHGFAATEGLGLLGEVGASGSWGVLTQTFVAPNLVAQQNQDVTRLETTYRRDFPDQGYTLVAGDSALRTGLLGRNAYFGGLQFGTNFNLAPYINRQPVPLIAGETSTPSTVQLYVNDVLRQTSNVPAGPFALENLPVLSGNGDVTVRVRDILGRETVITQPFLIAAELLAPGTTDWSAEVGALRQDLGVKSFNYGDGFASGMVRRGLSTTTTAEVRAEAARGRGGLGLAGVHAIGSDILIRGGAMASHNERLGSGARWLFGAERMAYSGNMSFMFEGNSRAFRSLGEEDDQFPVKLQFAGQASWTIPWGRVGFAVAYQEPHFGDDITTWSLNYGTTVASNWQLNLYYTRAYSRIDNYTLGAALVVPLDRNTASSTSVQHQGGRTEFYSTVSHTPATTEGLGWRALVANQGEARAEGGLNWFSPYGLFTAEAAVRRNQTDIRLGAVGAAVWAQNQVYGMQRFSDSAVLVSVPGQSGVGVGRGAQTGQRTDDEGYALVNGLVAYQPSPIRLNANDLPISAEVASLEQEVVAPWRSVAKLEFEVRGGKAALITVLFDDNEPAPAGATVRIEGEPQDFLVARKGEAYLTGLKDSNRLRLQWRGKECRIDLQLPPDAPEIARVGPLRCPGVTR